MSIWGALDVTSGIAAREVLEHTVVATSARLGQVIQGTTGPVVLTCFVLNDRTATAEVPDASLIMMERAADALGPNVDDLCWFGDGVLVSTASDTTLADAHHRAAHAVDAAVATHELPMRFGIASTEEAADPFDLVRLALRRAADGSANVPARRSIALRVSAGEQQRLDIIAANRNREPDALVREALDLLVIRHR